MTDTPELTSGTTKTLIVVPILSTRNDSALLAERKIEEAIGLAQAINLDVRASESVRVAKIRPATLFGSGKTKEIEDTIKAEHIEITIVDHPLTPIQQRNLELEWHCKVLDRTALILEIFGARARTYEGRLQVELAALQYQRSRLVRSWTHLERQRGGFGFIGGPGESQLEIDRRLTDQRITKLQNEISNIRKTRTLQRSARQRSAFPTVALVGYTNAGKSTLFNLLTESTVVAKDMLFATLDPTMRSMTLPSGLEVILCDTVGFISDLPTELVASFRATLEEIVEADLVLHVQDASAEEAAEQRATVEEIVAGLIDDQPLRMIDVYNKIDLVDRTSPEPQLPATRNDAIYISAISGEGIDRLLELLDREFVSRRQVLTYDIPSSDGAALAWLYKNGEVISNDPQDLSSIVKVALQTPDIGRFEQRFHLEHQQ